MSCRYRYSSGNMLHYILMSSQSGKGPFDTIYTLHTIHSMRRRIRAHNLAMTNKWLLYRLISPPTTYLQRWLKELWEFQKKFPTLMGLWFFWSIVVTSSILSFVQLAQNFPPHPLLRELRPRPPSISHPSVLSLSPCAYSNNSLFLCSDAASHDISAPGESKWLPLPIPTPTPCPPPQLVDSSLEA